MNVIAKRTLRAYWEQHPDTRAALQEWHRVTVKARWEKPSNVPEAIPNARFVGNGRFVFKIRGNNYRLVVKMLFPTQQVFIRFIGTHSEYDQIDATTI